MSTKSLSQLRRERDPGGQFPWKTFADRELEYALDLASV
jgi:N-acetyl-anhydromuramyl-L-alanine amidase AmpD